MKPLYCKVFNRRNGEFNCGWIQQYRVSTGDYLLALVILENGLIVEVPLDDIREVKYEVPTT